MDRPRSFGVHRSGYAPEAMDVENLLYEEEEEWDLMRSFVGSPQSPENRAVGIDGRFAPEISAASVFRSPKLRVSVVCPNRRVNAVRVSARRIMFGLDKWASCRLEAGKEF